MKAWRFHRFNDMRLDDVPESVCGQGQVLAEPLCVVLTRPLERVQAE